MKKSILNLGKALDKVEQKNIQGGFSPKKCEVANGLYCDVLHVCENGFCKKIVME